MENYITELNYWAMFLVRGLYVGLCGMLWRMGGTKDYHKLFRRLGIPALTAVFIWGFKAHWLGYLSLPLMFWVYSMGYGVNSRLTRLLKNKYLVRLIYGLLAAAAGTFMLWNNWWLLGYHALIVSTGIMLAGNQKFQLEDKREEFFIGCLIVICPMIHLPL